MSKFEDQMKKAMTQLDDLGVSYNKSALENIGKSLGPALYNKDASLVSTTSNTEMETVKKNFAVNKLGVSDEEAQKACDKVAEKMKGINQKQRVNFYYMIAQELGKVNKFQ